MDRPIRVVISTHVGEPWGGIGTLYGDLFKSRFSELVRVVYIDNHPGTFSCAESGRISQSNLVSALTYLVRFVRLLLHAKPDVAHIATTYGSAFAKQSIAVIMARVLGARVVLAPHCSYQTLISGNRLWRAYSRFVLGRCNGLVALSKEWLAVQQQLPGCLVEYLPNSIDLKPYRELPRPRPDKEDHCVNVLFFGHIGRDKGSFDLVHAASLLARILPPASWQIGLHGEALRFGEPLEVQRLIDELGLHQQVQLRPPVFDTDKVACLARADIFVLPSYHEGMPISLIEAMASGLPIVATRVGGIPDLVTDGENGLLVSPGRPGDLAEALAKLIGDHILRTRMGLKGRQRALAYHDLDARVPELVKFHEKVAAGSQDDAVGSNALPG